jgi:hypothetical protein
VQPTQLVVAPVLLSQAQPGVPSSGSDAQLVFFVAAVLEPVQVCAQFAPYFWSEHGVMHGPPADASVWKPALQPVHCTFPPAVLSQVTPLGSQCVAASVVEQAVPHSIPNLSAEHLAQLSLSSLSLKPFWHVPHVALLPSVASQVMPSACHGQHGTCTGKVHDDTRTRL